MREFVFVLGKNFDLSAAEIACFLKAKGIGFEVKDFLDPFLVVEAERLPEGAMDALGGTIKIAEVLFSSGKRNQDDIAEEMMKKLDFEKLFASLPEKALFAVSAYGSGADAEFFSEFLKQRMKEVGVSPGYMHSTEPLTHMEVLKKHLLEKGAEYLACRGKVFRLAKTVAVHDPEGFKKRDAGKPVQRTIFSIPPRLCRIMINLSMAKGALLDPFCGIGCILMEAGMMGFDIMGLDIDKECVAGCKKNLEWLQKEYKLGITGIENKIKVGDAKRLSSYFGQNSADAIVTEPYLGKPLLERPGLAEARIIIEEVKPLYSAFLKEAAKVLRPGARAVVISPFFEVDGKNIGLDMRELAEGAGLSMVDPLEESALPHKFPLSDFEERHSTLRMINILQK